MGKIEEQLERLRRWNADIAPVETEAGAPAEDEVLTETLAQCASEEDALALESIIMRRRRPVLAIKDNKAELVFSDNLESGLWRERLDRAMPHIENAARTVGRIELAGGPLDWVGTGWLVRDEARAPVLVTNRHVAEEFAYRDGESLDFRLGDGGPIRASADFLQEIDNPKPLIFRLLRPMYIEDAAGPDVAFFEMEAISGNESLAAPVTLATKPRPTENAATIGYPAYDSRIPEPDLMERIYGRIYNKKRLAPGAVTKLEPRRLHHNCTTLGGNSGSLLLDLDSGEVLGLHYSGSFLTTNYAVRADIIAELLHKARRPRRSGEGTRPAATTLQTDHFGRGRDAAGGRVLADVTIPLTITVSLGEPATTHRARTAEPSPVQPSTPAGDEVEGEEGRIEDYRDRGGYRRDFLGPDVPLPRIERDAADVLEFQFDGKTQTELHYDHFSVVMSRSRRMCILSAVNISGGKSRKSKRGPWRWDPRVPRAQQIMNECYGSPPRFSRGHMTRREDPGWGDTEEEARRGNRDSMHVTNVAPQMQAFNSPIWLALEDYALDNARSDRMDISVFTGPYFTDRDPEMYGVRIPLSFWKVIAFIHDETKQLCATGYELNQSSSLLPQEEFVFGQFVSPQLGLASQVPVRSISERSGLSFGDLTKLDPLSAAGEHSEGVASGRSLTSFEQVRYFR